MHSCLHRSFNHTCQSTINAIYVSKAKNNNPYAEILMHEGLSMYIPNFLPHRTIPVDVNTRKNMHRF